MLVLSRKENEVVVFPNLGISVRINKIAGKKVRVGIEAPDEIPVLRGEVAFEDDPMESKTGDAGNKSFSHRLRNELNTIRLAFYLLPNLIAAGRFDRVEQTLETALSSLDRLDRQVARESQAAAGNSQRQRPVVLLVEDDANERELLAGVLEMQGYDVRTARDGIEAWEYLSTHHTPDFVLLDMNMPRMNGLDTVHAIRVDPRFRGLKVFAVTGEERTGRQDDEGFFDQWFQKPIHPQEFADRLEFELAAPTAG